MKNKSVIVLVLVVLVVGGIALAQSLNKGRQDGDPAVSSSSTSSPSSAQENLDNLVAGALNGKKPAMLVFTYEADCCPSTREYFNQHKLTVQELESKYKHYVNFAWIDVAFYQETERRALMKLAKKYSVASIPAVILIGKDGQASSPIIGEIDSDEMDKQLQRLVNGL